MGWDKKFSVTWVGKGLTGFKKRKFSVHQNVTSIIAWVLLHLFALEHFSAGTVNEYERDCICVDSTGLL